MDQQSFQRSIVLLSGEHSLSILRSLRDANWHISSEVARSLDIHITTASKFLQRFAELGLVERREHESRAFQYRLRSPPPPLHLHLLDDTAPVRAESEFYIAHFHPPLASIRPIRAPAVP